VDGRLTRERVLFQRHHAVVGFPRHGFEKASIVRARIVLAVLLNDVEDFRADGFPIRFKQRVVLHFAVERRSEFLAFRFIESFLPLRFEGLVGFLQRRDFLSDFGQELVFEPRVPLR
jgi:hypothetical protein